MILPENNIEELVEYLSNLSIEIRNRIDKMDARLDDLEKTVSKIQKEKTEDLASEKPSTNFENILNGTIGDVQTEIRGLKSPDYQAFLNAEKKGKNRKTLKKWLRKQISRSTGAKKN